MRSTTPPNAANGAGAIETNATTHAMGVRILSKRIEVREEKELAWLGSEARLSPLSPDQSSRTVVCYGFATVKSRLPMSSTAQPVTATSPLTTPSRR